MTLHPLRWFGGTLREWSWRHTALGVLIGALALFNMGGLLQFPPGFAYGRNLTYNIFEFGLPSVFAIRVADRAVADGVPRALAYSVAVVGMIALGVWVIGPLLLPLIGGEAQWTARDDTALALNLLLPFALAAVGYAGWRRERDTLERVQADRLARAEQERLLQAARLLALQARVEPQFLFDALGRVRAAIERSAADAEQRLTDLIALLRALQPAAGATASSLGRELRLVQAYARAAEAAALQPPRLTIDVEADAARALFAPLVLLPALRSLVGDAPHAQWQLGAMRLDDRLRIVVAPGEPGAAASSALDALDRAPLVQRLVAVHGPDAQLATRVGAAPALHIDLPFDATDRDDDDHPRPDR